MTMMHLTSSRKTWRMVRVLTLILGVFALGAGDMRAQDAHRV